MGFAFVPRLILLGEPGIAGVLLQSVKARTLRTLPFDFHVGPLKATPALVDRGAGIAGGEGCERVYRAQQTVTGR